MPVKIRLQRQGKKKQPFYHIVVADSRSKRDGKYIERLGTYNPRFDREGVTLDNDKTLAWLEKGALPTDSCRNILSERGIILKKHLMRGVKKGLFTPEQLEEKFAKWTNEKEAAYSGIKEKKSSSVKEASQQRIAAEKAAKEAKAKVVAEKRAAAAEKAAAAAQPKTEATPPPAPETAAPAEPEAAPQA